MIDDQNFANLFRQTPEMVCILAGPEHRFEFVNEAHIRALGFDATGQAVREAQPESVEVHGILDEVYRTGVTAALREIAVTLTDRTRYFDLTYAARRSAAGDIDGIMIMGSEVTGQVLARRAQEHQRRWLESVLNRLPSPTLFLEPASGDIVFQNYAATQLLSGAGTEELRQAAGGAPLHDHALELETNRGKRFIEASADVIPAEFGQPETTLLVLKNLTAQKRAQERLQRSEDQLTLALESSKTGFYDWNITEDSVTLSAQMREHWGIGDDTASRTLAEVFEFVHPNDRERVQRRIAEAMRDRNPYQLEYRVARPDGKTIWVEVRGKVHYAPDGAPVRFFGTSSDISARVEHERDLRALADSMPQVVWTARPDGVLDYTNQRWTGYSGSSDPAVWLQFVFPGDRDRAIASWSESVASGRSYETEFRLLRASDKTYRWHLVRAEPARDDAGRVTRWFGTCTDIDDQKRNEDLFRFLAEVSVVLSRAGDDQDYTTTISTVTRLAVPLVADWAAVDLSEPDGTFRRVSVAHTDVAKVAQAQELWRRWPPQHGDAHGVARVVETGVSEIYPNVSEDVLSSSALDPERLHSRASLGLKSTMCVPLHVRGKVIGAISLSSAESGRRFTVADLRVAEDFAQRLGVAIDNAQLLRTTIEAKHTADEANRLKDEFLATISHELRTPLNAMLGWTRLLRAGQLPPERQERALETIERNAVTQAQLIEDLLDVARIVSGKLRLEPQSVGLAHVIEYAIDSLRLASDARKIQIITALDPRAGAVIGDPHRLGQVVWNLLSNAIKFTPRGGRINVQLERVDSNLHISVADTGQGIAAEFLPHVFERFKQEDGKTTRAHGGLGLGLAISRHIVELHGGSISVKSQGEGQGSTFTVSLPVAPLRPEIRGTAARFTTVVGHAQPAERPELVDLEILVVDDEGDARDLVVAVLEQLGAKVTAAGSVAEAMAAVAQGLPDLLLSDIGMPGEDGYALIRKFRALPGAESIPAAALTAYARAEDRRKALDAGFMMHIPKPVEPAELIAVIANLTRFRAPQSSR
ncbi:MAG: Two-component hybrid sensor and regulator [Polyangiaceae bacterium]|jgi:PAS domain S-box-containing protein|nr:Two-component hybrid sensor and regulator [Polyangiaceae bacterium]